MTPPLSHNRNDVLRLFADMAATYGVVNLVSSLGFAYLWRRACVKALGIETGQCIVDLMAGMGEASALASHEYSDLAITAVDFCPQMCERARKSKARETAKRLDVRCEDVLAAGFGQVFDRAICTFGIKTLDDDGLGILAHNIFAALRGGGRAAFVEIYLPSQPVFRIIYSLYLRIVIPLVGRVLLGDPECYRMLYHYTADFVLRDKFEIQLRDAGFSVTARRLFFGCAKIYIAEKTEQFGAGDSSLRLPVDREPVAGSA